MAISITEAELLEALAESVQGTGPAEAKTVLEIAAASRIGEKRVRAALNVLKAQGRLQVHRVLRPRLDDTLFPTSAYTILPAKKKR